MGWAYGLGVFIQMSLADWTMGQVRDDTVCYSGKVMAVDLTARSGDKDMIADLLPVPFSRRPFEEKKRKLLEGGSPTPKMNSLTQSRMDFIYK